MLFIWGRKETKKLGERLEKEIITRKNSEKRKAEENAEQWKALYQQEKESREWHCERTTEREKEISDLRKQLLEQGVLLEDHDISDKRRRRDVIREIRTYWESKQSKNGKINGRTVAEVLGGEKWISIFRDKEGEEIIKVKDWLVKKIDDELELAKK